MLDFLKVASPKASILFHSQAILTHIFDFQSRDFQTTFAVRTNAILVPSRRQLFATFVQRHVQRTDYTFSPRPVIAAGASKAILS